MPKAQDAEVAYRIPERVAARTVAGEVVLLDLESGTFFSLNATGTSVWRGLVNAESHADIVAGLVSDYDVTETIAAADMDELLRDLEANGLVERP